MARTKKRIKERPPRSLPVSARLDEKGRASPAAREGDWEAMKKKLEKFGLLEKVAQQGSRNPLYLVPQNHRWRLASWFSDFVNAPDFASLELFKEEASQLAATVAGPATRELTDDDLLTVQREAREAINWFLERRTEKKEGRTYKKGEKLPPPLLLPPINGEEILQWVGDKVERTFLPEDFRGKLLSRLFALLSSKVCHFWRCQQCHKILSRRGPQIYCGRRCLIRARPVEQRREYQKKYMRERRKREFVRWLKSKDVDLWKAVVEKKKTVKEARRELRLIA